MSDYPLFESFLLESGTYVGLRPDAASKQKIVEYCESLGIGGCVDPDELHCTLVYSETNIDDELELEPDATYSCRPVGLAVLGSDSALVIKLKSSELKKRWQDIHDTTNAEWSYDSFIPHITIKYDSEYSDSDIGELSSPTSIGNIVLTNEYRETLNEDVAK